MPHSSATFLKRERRRKPRLKRCVNIVIEPGRTVPLEDFESYPDYSFALDGYVAEPPWQSDDGKLFVLNHHEGVVRLATRSTAGQAEMLVETGLVQCCTKDGVYTVNLYGQDCDQDVFWAMYILKYPEDVHRPLFHQLASLADLLDTTSGLFPVNTRSQLLRRLLWISDPYTVARAEGRLHPKRDYEELRAEMTSVVEQCHRRIRQTLYGRGKKIEPNLEFEVMKDFGKWQFIREIGTEARLGVAESGVLAFASFVGVQPEGGPYRYVLHRRSRQVQYFPVEDIVKDLNLAEGRKEDDPTGWGSGDVCGGSPRSVGSPLTWEQVCKVIARRVELGPRKPVTVKKRKKSSCRGGRKKR